MSRPPGPTKHNPFSPVVPARTPGLLGFNDAADPNCAAAPGDTPGSLGVNDAAALLPNSPGGILLAQAGGPLPRPKAKAGSDVEMYPPGESPTFDKLKEEVKNLGITRLIAPGSSLKSRDADYDPVSNTLRISREGYENYLNYKKREDLRRYIVHELSHAKQHKTLLQDAKDPEARKRLLRKQALSMSEDEYVKFRWNNELQAERTAWEVNGESIDSFEKSRRGKGFPADFLKEITDTRVREFTEQTKAAYETDFRVAYRRMLSESQSAQP